MNSLGGIDERKLRAYELGVAADAAAQAGRLEEGRGLMQRAATLNRTYQVRAELFGVKDERHVRVTATLGKLLVPFLLEAGFDPVPTRRWQDGLQRVRGKRSHALLVGPVKFGGAIGVNAARWSNPAAVAYFNWHSVGLRSGELAYRTRCELEAVCRLWRDLLSESVFPWFDGTSERWNPDAAR